MDTAVGQFVNLHLDGLDPQEKVFGSGFRTLVVNYVGRVWIECMDPTTLRTAKFHRSEYERMKPRLLDVDTQRVCQLLRRSYRTNVKHGLTQPTTKVKTVIQALGQQTL